MTELQNEHNSHRFAFNIDNLPATATDRFSRLWLLPAFFFGLLLCLLGLFYFMPDCITGKSDMDRALPSVDSEVSALFSPNLFNMIIILTGVLIIVMGIKSWYTRTHLSFDGRTFTITRYKPFKKATTITEDLYNYLGVRLRVRFYQFGLFTKNKFIIELYHKNPDKIVPLYMTTKRKGIRRIWQSYTQKLRMPGITVSEKGMVSHNFKKLKQPYADVVSSWHLPENFASKLPQPHDMVFKRRQTGEKMIRQRGLSVDVFSILGVMAVGILFSLFCFAVSNHPILLLHMPLWSVWTFYTILLALMTYILMSLTARDIIMIAGGSFYLFRKILCFRIRYGVVPIREIKGIDINYTPTTERYYLLISSIGSNYVIGNKLPVMTLRWLRAVLINEIIGN